MLEEQAPLDKPKGWKPVPNCVDCGDSVDGHALYSDANGVDLVCEVCGSICWNQAVLLHPGGKIRKGNITTKFDNAMIAVTRPQVEGG